MARLFTLDEWLIVVLAGMAALILGLGSLYLLQWFARPLALLILGIAIAAAIYPFTDFLTRWLPRSFAIVMVYLVSALLLFAILWMVAPLLSLQINEVVKRFPDWVQAGRIKLNSIDEQVFNSVSNSVSSQLANIGGFLVALPVQVFSSLFEAIFVIFISLYGLIAAPEVASLIKSLFPPGEKIRVLNILEEMVIAMGGYVRGALLSSLVIGLVTYIGLTIIGIDFALIFGVLAAILELIPIIGPIISGTLLILFTLMTAPNKAFIALVFMVVVQQLENNLLVPYIMRSQANVSPLLAILSLFAGTVLGGLLGALVAIPIAAALQVIGREVVAPWLRVRTGVVEDVDIIVENPPQEGE